MSDSGNSCIVFAMTIMCLSIVAAFVLGGIGYYDIQSDLKELKNNDKIKVANNMMELEMKLEAQTGDVSVLNSTTENLKQHYLDLLSSMDMLNRSIDYASAASVKQIHAELNSVKNTQIDILKKLDTLSHLNDTEDHLKLREEMSSLSSFMTNLTQNVTGLEKKIETNIGETRRGQQNVAKWQEMYKNNLSMVVKRVSYLEQKDYHNVNGPTNKSNKAISLENITLYMIISTVILSLV